MVLTAGRSSQLTGQTDGEVWLGGRAGGGPVEMPVLAGRVGGYEVSVTITQSTIINSCMQ